MDASTFDHLARTLFRTTSRRAALGVLLASAGVALGRAAPPAAAQGCKANRARCQDDAECCSGLCKRRSGAGKKRCRRADQQGICTIEQNVCTDGTATTVCGTGAGTSTGNCFCWVTSRGRSFCGGGLFSDTCGCTSNRQCEQVAGKGAKCVLTGPRCLDCGTVCVPPCPQPTTPA